MSDPYGAGKVVRKVVAPEVAKVFGMKKKSGIKKKVIRDIHLEMNKATAKHGWYRTPLNPQMPDGQKLVVLAEEIGEVAGGNPPDLERVQELTRALGLVARAMTYDNGDRDSLYAELIQVATMAASWAQSLRAKQPKDWVTT